MGSGASKANKGKKVDTAKTVSTESTQQKKTTVVASMRSHQNPVVTNLSTWESGSDPYGKLEIGMNHLMRIDKDATCYIETSKKVMQHLHQEFQKLDEVYLPWVRFFDISVIKKEAYPGKKEDTQGYIFRKGMEDLIIDIIGQSQSVFTMDWRIAKKILNVPIVFPENSRLLPLIATKVILRAFQMEIEKALDRLIWLPPTNFTDLAKQSLQILHNCFNNEPSNDLLDQAIIVGRFDKSKFDLKNSLVLGEDGGLFLLLNRLTKEQQEEMVKENIVTKVYLKDKIQPEKEEGGNSQGDKVVLGQGGFGKVRFALSLFGSKKSPGELVCVKKTKNFEQLAPKHGELIPSALQSATQATLEDYFAKGAADKVYAPQIFDLAIVATREFKEVSPTHQKGYLMMEVFPQNTATKMFKEPKFQRWIYQKPFLQEVMLAILELLKDRFAFTDLKPDNVLFDPETFKSTIIDLGGIIKISNADSLDSFEKSKYSCQLTSGYHAPEMKMGSNIINLSKALAYTCGKVLEEVVQKSDYNLKTLKGLIDKLINPKPEKRITIEEALKRLKEMGDNTENRDTLLEQYIHKIRKCIQDDRSSISINEDIHITKELYIDLKVTPRDSERYNDQETEDLFQKIDTFFAPDQLKHQVMAIFGSAGSGKSIALQLKFIEAIQKWVKGQPLPVYFNLANGIDLKSIINSMNSALGTNVKLQELHAVHLYIDSFDEGLEIEKKRDTLVSEYIMLLETTTVKVLITCRSDYLKNDDCTRWFTPKENALDKLTTSYVAPMGYTASRKTEKKDSNKEETKENGDQDGTSWKKNVAAYIELKREKENTQLNQIALEETLEKMSILNLDKLIDTGLMFHIIMEVLSDLFEDENQSRSRSKQYIYLKYITKYQKERLDQLTEEQRNQIIKCVSFMSQKQEKAEFSLNKAIRDLGKYLAVQLHLQNQFRLDQDASIFQSMGYENTTYFKKQSLWHILQILPLKIETKHSTDLKNQEVKIGFIHDTIKNCYLLDAIQEEMLTQNGKSKILSSKSIIENDELVSFIADAAFHDDGLKTYLRRAIDFTKDDKSDSAAIYAANCITILVSARYSFWGQDLSNVNIKGSNLYNGIFGGTDFTGADLRETNMRDIQAIGAKFGKANLIGAKLEILPDLEGHTSEVNSVSFSSDGRYVASGSRDKTVKIWEIQTNKCLSTLEGHTSEVNSVSFSSDGRYVASGSRDKTVKIWEIQTNKCLSTLQSHTEEVRSVSFSSDGRYVASCSEDKTVKIWEIQTNRCLSTLEGHTSEVNSVSFSSDGRYVASCSLDETVKIWEIQTNKCLSTLEGHTSEVNSVSFSSDGRYVASGSLDKTVKIWEIQTNKCLSTLEGHTSSVTSVSFSSDGRYVASGSSDETVKIWEIQTNKCLSTLEGHTSYVFSVSFSSDGRYVASGSLDETMKIWEIQTNKCLSTLQGHTSYVRSVSFSSDGRYVASCSEDKTVKIWEIQTNKCLSTLEGHTSYVFSVSVSSDGRYVASCSLDKTVKIWEIQTNKCLSTLEGHTSEVNSVSFSSDGRYVASGSSDETVKIWEIQTNKCLSTLEGHTSYVFSVSFSSDGRYVASGSRDKTVKIWEIQTNKCLSTLEGHTSEVNSVSFSSDGRYVASGSRDKTVKIWEIQTNKCLSTLQGHTERVNSVSFSSDGRYVASCSLDKTVKIWEIQTNKCLSTLEDHTSFVNSVSFSSDGAHVASASHDKSVMIWTNSNGTWALDKIFGSLPLRVRDAVIEETTLSTTTLKIFEQREAKVAKNNIVIDTIPDIEHDSKDAKLIAGELSVQFLKHPLETYKKLKRQKLVQIDTSNLELTKLSKQK